MKRYAWLTAALAGGLLGYAWVQHRRAVAEDVRAWIQQQPVQLDVLACPYCRGKVIFGPLVEGEGYHCPACHRDYPFKGGIAHFIEPDELSGLNRRFSRLYDWFSWGYRAFTKAAFALIGMREETARRQITDRLQPAGGAVLEVSIGPGVNLPYLVTRDDVGEIFGLDISPGQLNRCREYAARSGWRPHLQLGSAEYLPYQDNCFAGVLHIGGINFFNDRQKAIEEMIRVAQPGARILICDEKERAAAAYEKTLPFFKQSTRGRAAIETPVDLLPPEMRDVRVEDIWKGWFYLIEFTKPEIEEMA